MPSYAQTSYHHEAGSWAPLVFLGAAIGGTNARARVPG
jgi:hypothetical protein